MTREKIIHTMKLVHVHQGYYKFYLISSSGAYIKEFVHGDLERTYPNLGVLLGQSCDIFQLDVIRLFPHYDEDVEKEF